MIETLVWCMHCARNSVSMVTPFSTFSSSTHSVSPNDPACHCVKTLDAVPPSVFTTSNPTCVVFWKVIFTGCSPAGYIVSPSCEIKIGSSGGQTSTDGGSVGETVGDVVGELVAMLGPSDGISDGPSEGMSEGMADGLLDGVRDGPSEGMSEGLAVGSPVGESDGVSDRSSVRKEPQHGTRRICNYHPCQGGHRRCKQHSPPVQRSRLSKQRSQDLCIPRYILLRPLLLLQKEPSPRQCTNQGRCGWLTPNPKHSTSVKR